MANKKTSTGRLDADVQRFRDDSNWKKVIELAELHNAKTGKNEQLVTFLLGEAKLEQYLEEHPPFENATAKAKVGLTEARQLLRQSAGEDGSKNTASMDAQLLLAKLHFACGEYKEALHYLTEARLEHLTEKPLPTRSLRVVAESFAVHGLALEKVPPLLSSKYQSADKEKKILKSLETAGDITLHYFQEQDRQQGQINLNMTTSGSNSPLPPMSEPRIGLLLETALLRAPLIHIRAGRWNEAISRYRTVLSAVESSATSALRLTFARQLAEILLRRVCQATYVPFGKSGSEGAWKSKRYTGSGLFNPRDVNEEVFLLLLIAEAMAVRDVVLSQSAEFRDIRKTAMRNVTAIYDLLTISCVHHGQINMLCESLERALKFSFEDSHIWSQFAYSLIAAGKYHKSVLVLKEVARLKPENPLPCLMAAKVCLEHLNAVDDAYQWASQAVERVKSEHSSLSSRYTALHQTNHNLMQHDLVSRCLLFKGLACFIKWRQSRIGPLKQQWMKDCLEALGDAVKRDPCDHLVHFYFALTHAHCRQISQALIEVRTALRLRGEHLPSLILLALLLSTSAASPSCPPPDPDADSPSSGSPEFSSSSPRECQGALSLIEATLDEYPQNFDLFYVKALLEEKCHGGETALVTAKEMLALWKLLYEDACGNADTSNLQATQNHSSFDTKSLALSTVSAQPLSNEIGDREGNGSIYAQSVAAARAEQALSDVTSSLSSNIPRPGPQRAWHVQLRIWLLTGELYVRLGKGDEAMACVQEAAALSPASHHIMYLRGLIHEQKKEFAEAKTCFENAVAISPFHVGSLQHLGLVFHYLGSHRLAEKTLRDAVRLDPMAENSWYNLGKVLESMGEYEAASDCMAKALQVQVTSPVVPFSSVPLCFE